MTQYDISTDQVYKAVILVEKRRNSWLHNFISLSSVRQTLHRHNNKTLQFILTPCPINLVRVAKELTSKRDILVSVGKVPTDNSGVLATANDSAGIKLQLEDSRVGAVGVEGRSEGVWSVVMVMVVVMVVRLGIGWTWLSDCWRVGYRGRASSVVVTHYSIAGTRSVHSL